MGSGATHKALQPSANGCHPLKSLFENMPADLRQEFFETLVASDRVKIERIVSQGHASPEGFWYDQDENEFVVVLQGSAGLRMDGEDDLIVLKPGDYVDIPAHARHRVEWTDPSGATIWLAVFYF
jgi:cupin 2 domain-containing protein